jgi:hypothetical protein
MIPLALILALASTEPTPAAPAPEPPPASTSDKLDEVRLLYQKTCGDRAYGSYDDLCNEMKAQISAYERDLRKEARDAEKAKAQKPPVAVKPQR